MCFKNLPIEFDENGKAKLLETAGDPSGTSATPIKQFVAVGSSSIGASSAGSAASTTPPRLSAWGTK